MRRALLVLVAVALGSAGAGCADDDPAAITRGLDVGASIAGELIAESTVGHELVPGSSIYLQLTGETIIVNAGCSGAAGPYRVDGSELVVTDLTGPEPDCDPALEEQDAWLRELLTDRPTIDASGRPDRFVITGADGDALVLVPKPTVVDQVFTGSTWALETIIEGGSRSPVPAGVGVEVAFAADGTYTIETGCSTGDGTWSGRDGTYRIEPPDLTGHACDEEATQVETAVLQILAGEVMVTGFEGDTIELSGNGGALGFRETD